ncbi:hypothetical protein B4U84_21900 [Westiellopsis prolifica IICB1]|nr:hypothetical protein B4U84_21900 [Westiellopsis prolifica IICB1]
MKKGIGERGSGIGDWGSGIGERGLGIGHWALGMMDIKLFSVVSPHSQTRHGASLHYSPHFPIPFPRSPIPNPRSLLQ